MHIGRWPEVSFGLTLPLVQFRGINNIRDMTKLLAPTTNLVLHFLNSLEWSLYILWQWAKSLPFIIVIPLRLNYFNLFTPWRVIQQNLNPMAKSLLTSSESKAWPLHYNWYRKWGKAMLLLHALLVQGWCRGHVCIMSQRSAESFFVEILEIL